MLCYHNIYTGAPQGGRAPPPPPPNFRLALLPPPLPPASVIYNYAGVLEYFAGLVQAPVMHDAVKQATCLQLKYPQLCTYTRVCQQELIIMCM